MNGRLAPIPASPRHGQQLAKGNDVLKLSKRSGLVETGRIARSVHCSCHSRGISRPIFVVSNSILANDRRVDLLAEAWFAVKSYLTFSGPIMQLLSKGLSQMIRPPFSKDEGLGGDVTAVPDVNDSWLVRVPS